MSADQKQYVASLIQTFITLIRYIFQLLILVATHKYIWTLVSSILLNLLFNFIFSEWVSHTYKEVFNVKESISKEEKKQIFDDTKATLCHKIGGTVLNSTDSIILSRYVGIVATGLYSNYSMILSSLSSVLNQVFGSFTSSLGNAHVEQNKEQKYISYRRLLFGNLWITSICTVCLYNLLNDFITVWVGSDLLLDNLTVTVLCVQFFMETARIISTSYTNGCGLFVKDKIRPVIEATINLVVSIIMTNWLGIAGVFVGTIVSHLCTVFWREPYLLYKYEFKKSIKEYWEYYGTAAILTLMMSFLIRKSMTNMVLLRVDNLLMWIFKAISVLVLSDAFLVILLHRNLDFKFFFCLIKRKFIKTEV